MATLPRAQDEATRIKYQGWLTDAQQAYNDLVTGNRARVFVDQNGERIEYDRASAGDLSRWITTIENALSPALAAHRRPRPIGFTY